jgi:hypothetical protein
MTGIVNGTWRQLVIAQDTVGDSDTMIILAECRSLMDYTSTIAIRYVGVHHDSESLVLKLRKERKRKLAQKQKTNSPQQSLPSQ